MAWPPPGADRSPGRRQTQSKTVPPSRRSPLSRPPPACSPLSCGLEGKSRAVGTCFVAWEENLLSLVQVLPTRPSRVPTRRTGLAGKGLAFAPCALPHAENLYQTEEVYIGIMRTCTKAASFDFAREKNDDDRRGLPCHEMTCSARRRDDLRCLSGAPSTRACPCVQERWIPATRTKRRQRPAQPQQRNAPCCRPEATHNAIGSPDGSGSHRSADRARRPRAAGPPRPHRPCSPST